MYRVNKDIESVPKFNEKEKVMNNQINSNTKTLRPHQEEALQKVTTGLREHKRGRMIMACGTGKTFTSLRIAEEMVSKGTILFMVPSLALVAQAMKEWTQESVDEITVIAVCSDKKIGKGSKKQDELYNIEDIEYPVTTDAPTLAAKVAEAQTDKVVIFSTYHSIDVISDAQKNHGLPKIDLIICDEAHRTTGQLNVKEEKPFLKIHFDKNVSADYRLYMTATPAIYTSWDSMVAKKENIAVYSMNDEKIFGLELYKLHLGEAIRKGLLCDYKLFIPVITEEQIGKELRKFLSSSKEVSVEEAARIGGIWRTLYNPIETNMYIPSIRRAVMFCSTIGNAKRRSSKSVSSKHMVNVFSKVIEYYQKAHPDAPRFRCDLDHIDGTHDALEKAKKLDWLRDEPEPDSCRILSNVRCLSEGVDVPALDAVIFASEKTSHVDIIQAVGRVMRKAKGKKTGYIIIPVVIPTGQKEEEVLARHELFAPILKVMSALYAHDERVVHSIQKAALAKNTKWINTIMKFLSIGTLNPPMEIKLPHHVHTLVEERYSWNEQA